MTYDEIVEFGFPVIQSLYRSIPEKFPCNAYVRDRMWDEAVNVLFAVARTYDPKKFKDLGIYIYKNVVARWADLAYRRLPLERMVSSIKHTNYGALIEPVECQRESNYQDVIDGTELFGLLGNLTKHQEAAVLGRINGQTYQEIADEVGTTKENMRVAYGRAIAKLKEMAGAAA